MDNNTCPICRLKDPRFRATGRGQNDTWDIACPCCGTFSISSEAKLELMGCADPARGLLAGCIREQTIRGHAILLLSSNGDAPANLPGGVRLHDVTELWAPRSIGERLDRSLLNLIGLSQDVGNPVQLYGPDHSVVFASNDTQFLFFLRTLAARGWLEKSTPVIPGSVTVSAEGWARAAELQTSRAESKQAFVAMSFDSSMEIAWTDGFAPGIERTGYRPHRVDKEEHLEKICDKIIADIRRSRFLIADFTLQKPGVYFEAGFALGLGLPVVWTCRKDDLERCHFDTRQYNHIVWETPEDLARQLKNRIEATIR